VTIELPDLGFVELAPLDEVDTPLRNAMPREAALFPVHPWPGDPLATGWRPFVVLPTNVSVQIVRQGQRGRCVNCQHRRELYRVSLEAGGAPTATEARCAPCWGLR
jgi:hypothetical protein